MKLSKPSPSMAVALLALFMSTTGGAIAAVNYARNSAAVDGYSAVAARSSNDKAAGKLVATSPAGDEKGKLPFKFLSGAAPAAGLTALESAAARGRNGSYLVPVADNAATQEQNLIDLGVGNLQLTCIDKDPAAGVEDASIRVGVTNYSSGPINVSRRLGTGRQFIRELAPGTVETFEVNEENTFSAQVQAPPSKTVIVEGTAFQRNPGSADSSCAGWATALFVG